MITGVVVVKYPTIPTFVSFSVNVKDGNNNSFNSGSAVVFKFDTTVGILLVSFRYNNRLLTPSSNSWFPSVYSYSNTVLIKLISIL